MTGEVDGGAALDGGGRRERAKQREKGLGASWEGAAREGAGHAGETPKQTFHAREGAGKREHPAVTLRRQCRLEVWCWCGEGRCLEQERVDERFFFY